MDSQDPRQVLARRLRALREGRWQGVKVKQAQLAEALGESGNGSVSVPLISSWESRTKPQPPPSFRLEDLATFFSTSRSFDGQVGHLLSIDELTEQELAARQDLLQELTGLRESALTFSRAEAPIPGTAQEITESLNAGPYRFEPGQNITIVCAQLPQEMLKRMPYIDTLDPDFIELYRYTDLDALLELFGHLRAANPTSRVEFRAAHELRPDDYTAHLVALGGVDWNLATSSVLERLRLPVTQVSDWGKEGGAYFEVQEQDGRKVAHRPHLDVSAGQQILREDVALFAWAASPFNRKRYVTICNGMYGRGTYGAVRALTDERFRDRNAAYLRETFGDGVPFCILSRVTVENGTVLTPDWTLPETRLFEWSGSL